VKRRPAAATTAKTTTKATDSVTRPRRFLSGSPALLISPLRSPDGGGHDSWPAPVRSSKNPDYHVRLRESAARFCIPRIEISTGTEAFIQIPRNRVFMRRPPVAPQIAVPNWLIQWSKSRDVFLSLAHDPWVFRLN